MECVAHGRLTHVWRVACPFHTDDANGRTCRRALTFRDGDHDVFVQQRLQRWCLAGRMCAHARNPRGNSHAHLDWALVIFLQDVVHFLNFEWLSIRTGVFVCF